MLTLIIFRRADPGLRSIQRFLPIVFFAMQLTREALGSSLLNDHYLAALSLYCSGLL